MSGPAVASTRGLVEGALLAALGTALLLVVSWVPVATPLSLGLPLTVALAVIRHGWRLGALVAAVTALLAFAFLGPLAALLAGLQLVGVGLPLGHGVRRGDPAGRTILLTAAGFLVVASASLLLSFLVTGVDPIEDLGRVLTEAFREAARAAERLTGPLAVPEPVREQQRQQWEAAIRWLGLVLPATLLSAPLVAAFLSYLVAGAVLPRLGHPVPPLPPFAHWRLPAWTSFAFLGLWGAGLLLGRQGGGRWEAVWANLMLPFQLAFPIHGLATAYFFLRRWGLERRVAAVVLALGMLSGLGAALLFWLGLLEPVYRLRDWAMRKDGERAAP